MGLLLERSLADASRTETVNCAMHTGVDKPAMSELDHLGEELAYLKFWLGVVVVTGISLAGWFISSSETAILVIVWVVFDLVRKAK
jgi:hypothetical protein